MRSGVSGCSGVSQRGIRVRKNIFVHIFLCIMAGLILVSVGCGGGHIGSGGSFSTRFAAGIAHVAGNYGFTQQNFLIEGAQQISQLGSDSIFVYLTPRFRSEYPDQSSISWPAQSPANLAMLAQAKPYDSVFNLPFTTIVLSAFTFTAPSSGISSTTSVQSRMDKRPRWMLLPGSPCARVTRRAAACGLFDRMAAPALYWTY